MFVPPYLFPSAAMAPGTSEEKYPAEDYQDKRQCQAMFNEEDDRGKDHSAQGSCCGMFGYECCQRRTDAVVEGDEGPAGCIRQQVVIPELAQ